MAYNIFGLYNPTAAINAATQATHAKPSAALFQQLFGKGQGMDAFLDVGPYSRRGRYGSMLEQEYMDQLDRQKTLSSLATQNAIQQYEKSQAMQPMIEAEAQAQLEESQQAREQTQQNRNLLNQRTALTQLNSGFQTLSSMTEGATPEERIQIVRNFKESLIPVIGAEGAAKIPDDISDADIQRGIAETSGRLSGIERALMSPESVSALQARSGSSGSKISVPTDIESAAIEAGGDPAKVAQGNFEGVDRNRMNQILFQKRQSSKARDALLSAGYPEGHPIYNMLDPGERKFSEEKGKNVAEADEKLRQSSEKSFSKKYELAAMLNAYNELQNLGSDVGAFSNFTTKFGAILDSLGVASEDMADATSLRQFIRSRGNKLALEFIGGEDGMPANNFSEADREFVTQIAPMVTDQPGAFLRKIQILSDVAERNIFMANKRREFPDTKRGRDMYEKWASDYRKRNSLLVDNIEMFIDNLSKKEFEKIYNNASPEEKLAIKEKAAIKEKSGI